MRVRPKKFLGQHFLKDENIAFKIVQAMEPAGQFESVLEIGPGMGVLTRFLLQREDLDTWVIELDRDSVVYLNNYFPKLSNRIISGDFLKTQPEAKLPETFGIIGNFPYNISSQILFKAVELRNRVPQVVGMFQKEVAERVAAGPGNKTYGIMSVLIQAWFDIEYLFTVHEHVFQPPPKVKSGVIRLKRNSTESLACDEALFVRVVKAGFNQRRKTLRNATKPVTGGLDTSGLPFMDLRAERLSVDDFVTLTAAIEAAPAAAKEV